MKQENHAKFSSAKTNLAAVLKARYEDRLYKRNLGWAFAGLLGFAAAIWLSAAAVVAATGIGSLAGAGFTIGAILLAAVLSGLVSKSSTVGKCLFGALLLGVGAVVVTVGMSVVGDALASGWVLPLAIPALALPLVLSAFWWISAPTAEGRGVLDRIAGFKQYLSIAEGERLERMTPPDDTPELFEKYLPYAIALGVENRWADRFAGVLAAAAAHGRQGFAWYSGSSSPWDNPGGFAESVGGSLSSTISSASTAPGSSSGSGGGGSSGGGGGGGGGGGW